MLFSVRPVRFRLRLLILRRLIVRPRRVDFPLRVLLRALAAALHVLAVRHEEAAALALQGKVQPFVILVDRRNAVLAHRLDQRRQPLHEAVHVFALPVFHHALGNRVECAPFRPCFGCPALPSALCIRCRAFRPARLVRVVQRERRAACALLRFARQRLAFRDRRRPFLRHIRKPGIRRRIHRRHASLLLLGLFRVLQRLLPQKLPLRPRPALRVRHRVPFLGVFLRDRLPAHGLRHGEAAPPVPARRVEPARDAAPARQQASGVGLHVVPLCLRLLLLRREFVQRVDPRLRFGGRRRPRLLHRRLARLHARRVRAAPACLPRQACRLPVGIGIDVPVVIRQAVKVAHAARLRRLIARRLRKALFFLRPSALFPAVDGHHRVVHEVPRRIDGIADIPERRLHDARLLLLFCRCTCAGRLVLRPARCRFALFVGRIKVARLCVVRPERARKRLFPVLVQPVKIAHVLHGLPPSSHIRCASMLRPSSGVRLRPASHRRLCRICGAVNTG